MFGSPPRQNLAQSPLETIAIPLVVGGIVVASVLWAAGIIVGSIVGATLPGSVGEGFVAMVQGLPDVGIAWEPPIPSVLVWFVTCLVVAIVGPFVWKLLRAGTLQDEGAQWASTADLRHAGLLLADRSLPFAVPEPVEGPDAR